VPAAPAVPVDWRAAARSVARHPSLWATAGRQLVRLSPRGWWRRPPFLPRPDEGWAAFRLQTMYGDAGHDAEPGDLVTWLRWCRVHRAATGRGPLRRVNAGAIGPPGVG
jgi:hypothetical protein